jgi:putative transport protein
VPDRPTDVADVAFIGGAITLGALVGALVWKVGGVPLTLSTAGGALIAGLVFGWLRSTRPFFGRIPSSTVWFMNSVGLNVFIAVVGIASGPGFVELRIDRGDVMTLIGTKLEVERAAKLLGYPDWPTNATDMVFVGTGIVLGGLVGLLSVTVAGLPLTLTSSGGALIMGLVFGWLRSVMPIFGRMPEPAIWIFDTVGLCTFIGVVGLSAGPGFVAGLQKTGISLVLMGLVCSLVPHTVAILFGRYVLRMNPLILLGACAGAGTITAALRAIEDEAQSKVPALGYTVPYAVGNILLTAWGPVIVALMSMGR